MFLLSSLLFLFLLSVLLLFTSHSISLFVIIYGFHFRIFPSQSWQNTATGNSYDGVVEQNHQFVVLKFTLKLTSETWLWNSYRKTWKTTACFQRLWINDAIMSIACLLVISTDLVSYKTRTGHTHTNWRAFPSHVTNVL